MTSLTIANNVSWLMRGASAGTDRDLAPISYPARRAWFSMRQLDGQRCARAHPHQFTCLDRTRRWWTRAMRDIGCRCCRRAPSCPRSGPSSARSGPRFHPFRASNASLHAKFHRGRSENGVHRRSMNRRSTLRAFQQRDGPGDAQRGGGAAGHVAFLGRHQRDGRLSPLAHRSRQRVEWSLGEPQDRSTSGPRTPRRRAGSV